MTPFEEIQHAVAAYGEAAMENFLRCRAVGRALFTGMPAYFGCAADKVCLVPAQGAFDPNKDYGDAAFSFHQHEVIRLEPIIFGLCLIVPNAEDSRSLWLRTGVRVEVTGDTFDIFVSHQPMVRVPLDFEGHLTPVWDTIKREFLSVFRTELARFSDERYAGGIGFVPNRGAEPVTSDTGDA
ncbi:MAG: hypothetical protein ACWA5T_08020 [Parvularcula sp.]